jgi:Arc/MetJ-type ribon-helix-helix transcriptional regulator
MTAESTPACDGRRITVRLPAALCEDLDTLVEDGHFFHTSEVVRTALRRIVDAPDVHARSLDVYLLQETADQPDSTYDFKTREVADALAVSPQQLVQAIQAHDKLEDSLVAIEQWSDGSYRGALWRATPRLSFAGSTDEHPPTVGDD